MKVFSKKVLVPGILGAGLLLTGCSSQQLTTAQNGINTGITQGQLFCSKVTVAGPLVVGLVDLTGAPVLATNQTASFVAGVCGLIDGIPVVPPTVPVGNVAVSTAGISG